MPDFTYPPVISTEILFGQLWSKEQLDNLEESRKRWSEILHPEWKMSTKDRDEYEKLEQTYNLNNSIADLLSGGDFCKRIGLSEAKEAFIANSRMEKLRKQYDL